MGEEAFRSQLWIAKTSELATDGFVVAASSSWMCFSGESTIQPFAESGLCLLDSYWPSKSSACSWTVMTSFAARSLSASSSSWPPWCLFAVGCLSRLVRQLMDSFSSRLSPQLSTECATCSGCWSSTFSSGGPLQSCTDFSASLATTFQSSNCAASAQDWKHGWQAAIC